MVRRRYVVGRAPFEPTHSERGSRRARRLVAWWPRARPRLPGARTFMVALLSTGMFLINDSVKVAFGLPISATLDHVKKPATA